MGSSYSTEVQAQALALMRQGETLTAIGARLGVPDRTLRNWRERWREMADEKQEDKALSDDDYRLAHRAGQLLHGYLDSLEDRESPVTLQEATVLNILRGTSSDKIRERQRLEVQRNLPSAQPGPFVIFLAPDARPEDAPIIQARLMADRNTVEGAARVLDAPSEGSQGVSE